MADGVSISRLGLFVLAIFWWIFVDRKILVHVRTILGFGLFPTILDLM